MRIEDLIDVLTELADLHGWELPVYVSTTKDIGLAYDVNCIQDDDFEDDSYVIRAN